MHAREAVERRAYPGQRKSLSDSTPNKTYGDPQKNSPLGSIFICVKIEIYIYIFIYLFIYLFMFILICMYLHTHYNYNHEPQNSMHSTGTYLGPYVTGVWDSQTPGHFLLPASCTEHS